MVRTDTKLANEYKADFDNIYDRPDPRPYFHTLRKLNYEIPQQARESSTRIIRALRRIRGRRRLRVLDLGCSYGINGALLKHDLDLGELYARYGSAEAARARPAVLTQRDRSFFASHRTDPDLCMVGLDAAEHAVWYAKTVGLIDTGIVVNLEESDLSRDDAIDARVDVIVSTGCVGYVTATTFRRLMGVQHPSRPPWVVAYVLRMFPYDEIAAVLSDAGLTTHKLLRETFVQRSFADAEEQANIIAQLERRGISPEGLEDQGSLHAELFVTGPPDEVAAARLPGAWEVIREPSRGPA